MYPRWRSRSSDTVIGAGAKFKSRAAYQPGSNPADTVQSGKTRIKKRHEVELRASEGEGKRHVVKPRASGVCFDKGGRINQTN